MPNTIKLNNLQDPVWIRLEMNGEAIQNYTLTLYKDSYPSSGKELFILGKSLKDVNDGDFDPTPEIDIYLLFNPELKDWSTVKPFFKIKDLAICIADCLPVGRVNLKLQFLQGSLNSPIEIYQEIFSNESIGNIDDEYKFSGNYYFQKA